MKLTNKNLQEDRIEELVISLGEFILSKQASDGSIPSNEDGTHDPWDHLEAVMGLIIAKQYNGAQLGINWMLANQNSDGSWFNTYKHSNPIHKNKQSNHAVYLATAAHYYFLATGDHDYLEEIYPALKEGYSFLLSMDSSSGAFAWNIDEQGVLASDYLIAGNSSIFKSLESLFHIAGFMRDESLQKQSKASMIAIREAFKDLKNNFDLTLDRSRFSMDFYYPALCGLPFDEKIFFDAFDSFYLPNLGIKCVSEEPWVTVAETCECALALLKIGYPEKAKSLLSEVLKISDGQNIPFMGWQYQEEIFWPEEQPTWTAGAMLLLIDALYELTPAACIFMDSLSFADTQ